MKYQVILHMQKESYGRQDRDQATLFHYSEYGNQILGIQNANTDV